MAVDPFPPARPRLRSLALGAVAVAGALLLLALPHGRAPAASAALGSAGAVLAEEVLQAKDAPPGKLGNTSRASTTETTSTTKTQTTTSPWFQESEYKASEWLVLQPGGAEVLEEAKEGAKVLQRKHEGFVVVGRRVDGYLALVHEPGFLPLHLNGKAVLKRRSVSYTRLLSGSCADAGLHPIWDAHTCENAGFNLGYFDTWVGIYKGQLERPEGCYEYNGRLWMAVNPAQAGKGTSGARKQICSSNSYPSTTTTTTTTSTTNTTTETSTTTYTTSTTLTTTSRTTTTTTTWGKPSLFCVEVVRTTGYELPLVKKQLEHGASIFTCDEFRVFSDGGKSEIIGTMPNGNVVETLVIPPIKKKQMDLDIKHGITKNSWLNTETFLQVWDLAKRKDGRLLKHDWVVKVDPDAVFFPARLRRILRQHPDNGEGLYVMNCDKYNPVALYGSLEIFSRAAMDRYLRRQWDCRDSLDWHGWGEDYYMSHCMKFLHSKPLYNFDLIGDARCHYAPCSNISKVVYHDYKNQSSWFKCWRQSRKAEEEAEEEEEESAAEE